MDLSRFNISELQKSFSEALPFHHVIIDNFLEPTYLSGVVEEIKNYSPDKWYDKQNANINNEQDTIVQSKKIALTDYNKMGPLAKSVIDLTASDEFLEFLERITGIYPLEKDPSLFGGGIHKVSKLGKLSIHADFNIHPKLNKYRRLNVLLYLNTDWQESYNGELELWNKEMTECVKKIPPIFNRLVIFRITDNAFHGHPEPWLAPIEIPRLSFALYYYTEERPEEEKGPFHWALWQMRPGKGF